MLEWLAVFDLSCVKQGSKPSRLLGHNTKGETKGRFFKVVLNETS